MPLRSTGCHKCRQRKIRCDERRPSCMRCATHGVACPGYKTEAGGVEFRDETDQTVLRLNTADVGFSSTHSHGQRKPKKSPKERQALSPPRGYDTYIWKESAAAAKPENSQSATTSVSSARRVYLQPVCSPTANRQALYGKFMDLYHPQNTLPNEKGLWVSHLNYMSVLVTMSSCPPAMSHGLDALSLIQIGSVYNDRRLRHKAIEAYTKALGSLSLSLSKPASIHDDTVLAAVTILSICEFYTEFRLQGQNWISHQQGMQRLIEARGAQSLLNSRLALHLFYQSTSSALALSLLIRKENPYASERWHSMREKVAQLDDYSESFRTSLRLPGLLEKHDSLDTTDPAALSLIDDLLMECSDLECEMNEFLANLHANTETDPNSWPALIDIEAFQPFAKLVTDRTMSRAFKFPTFMAAYLYSSHWMRMYLLRQMIQSLHEKRRALMPTWIPADDQFVKEQELLCYILNLCRQIPYFIEPGNSAIGEMCCFFPLFVAETYFRNNSHWRWVEWVHHISDRIFHKGMSMPFITDRGDVPVYKYGAEHEQQYEFNWLELPTLSPVQNVIYHVSPTATM